MGTVVSWDPVNAILQVQNIIPFNTGNINIGIAGYLYEFSQSGTVVDFFIQNAGTNYTATPTVTVENVGDIQATGTVNTTTAGDQVESITISNGGYGINQSVDGNIQLTQQSHLLTQGLTPLERVLQHMQFLGRN